MEKILIVKHKNKDTLVSFLNTLYAVANDQGIIVEVKHVIKEKIR